MDKRVNAVIRRIKAEQLNRYAVNHFHCGCHIIESAPGLVDITHSHFCEKSGNTCKYAGVYRSYLLEETFTLEERQSDYGRLRHEV